MKAITLHQPWASLVALGVKTIETRSRPTKVRGHVAIHAGRADLKAAHGAPVWDAIRAAGLADGARLLPPLAPLAFGAIVATADLYDCVPMLDSLGRPGDGSQEIPPALLLDGLDGHMWIAPEGANVEDQRPYGDFTPGRWAWLLRDVKPTTERCPACWGDGGFKVDSMTLYGIPGGEVWGELCLTCQTAGRCDPIPAKGRQGWWEWTP